MSLSWTLGELTAVDNRRMTMEITGGGPTLASVPPAWPAATASAAESPSRAQADVLAAEPLAEVERLCHLGKRDDITPKKVERWRLPV